MAEKQQSHTVSNLLVHRLEKLDFVQQLARRADYLFLMRPTLFFPVWTIYAAGYFAGQHFFGDQAIMAQPQAGVWPILIGIGLTMLMGSVFIINQIVDAEIDRQNNKLFLIANGHVPRVHARNEAIILAIIAMALAVANSIQTALLFALIFLITGVLYSLPPFKWKDRALRGLFGNALGALAVFGLGWQMGVTLYIDVLIYSIPYVCAVAAVYVYTTLLDITGDAKFGKSTYAVEFGENMAIYTGSALEIFAFAVSWWLNDPIMLYPALFATPLFVVAAVRRQQKDIELAIKLPIFFLAIIICYLWPPFFIVIFLTYFIAKFYYRIRFGIHYPNLWT